MQELRHDQVPAGEPGVSPRGVAGKIEAFGWGLFFIWIGIAFLADVGWAAGILGVGVIALGTQAARKAFGQPIELFGLAMGLVMVGWGAWELLGLGAGGFDLPSALLPILLIALGLSLVLGAFLRKPR